MRYSQSHKDETHAKILKIAGRALRAKGPEGVAVAEVMKEAGLTHGGFYAHFKSKDALLAEALEGVFEVSRRKFLAAVEGLPPKAALAAYVDFYVSPRHRDGRESGCPLTALNSDMPRQSKELRDVFGAGMTSMVLGVKTLIENAGVPGDAETLAASVISAMAGAVAIARTVADKTLSDEILASARESIKTRLGVGDVELSRDARQ
jgi:TetR/AcrR family transcriptional regulator, transcriptional repressor for nem operon